VLSIEKQFVGAPLLIHHLKAPIALSAQEETWCRIRAYEAVVDGKGQVLNRAKNLVAVDFQGTIDAISQ
jgi:hypothetical protein